MNITTLKVTQNQRIASDVYRMVLAGDVPELAAGSFVELSVPNCYLRRPFSVCASDKGTLTLIYKVVGRGTDLMSRFPVGTEVETIAGLGQGFHVERSSHAALLVGGGLGVAPLYQLARVLRKQGVTCTVVAGFNRAEDAFLEAEFEALSCEVRYVTMDGSHGRKGLVTDHLADIAHDYFYSCGPLPMLKALQTALTSAGDLSLEARMGCGYGACMGCTIQTVNGPKRVCKEGPVFEKEEVIW